MVALGGGAVSYERGTHVTPPRSHTQPPIPAGVSLFFFIFFCITLEPRVE